MARHKIFHWTSFIGIAFLLLVGGTGWVIIENFSRSTEQTTKDVIAVEKLECEEVEQEKQERQQMLPNNWNMTKSGRSTNDSELP